ncbi:methyltransferase domain-containing protein [Streptomyces sp. NPDC001205]
MTPLAPHTAQLLAAITEQLGFPVPAPYADALRTVPRHLFLPDRISLRDGHGGRHTVDKATDPGGWRQAAYSDAPLVTQFTADGAPSSAASMPSMMLRALLLGEADRLGPGARVLELGSGTGFNAGLLCALLGQDAVTTIDVDPALVAQAASNLKAAGYVPAVAAGDGADGWPAAAPYDLILATFSVDRVPDPWRDQLRPGGRIVTPWYSDWAVYGMLTLTTGPDRSAQGRFHPHGSYMIMRTPDGQPSTTQPLPGPPARASTAAAWSTAVVVTPSVARATSATGQTRLSPWAVTADPDTEFHLGLTVPHTSYAWDTSGKHAPVRFVLFSADSSNATVDYDGVHPDEFTVTQTGPRHLWTETENAYARWEAMGRPAVDRHGLSITCDGTHHIWIDTPANPVAAHP